MSPQARTCALNWRSVGICFLSVLNKIHYSIDYKRTGEDCVVGSIMLLTRRIWLNMNEFCKMSQAQLTEIVNFFFMETASWTTLGVWSSIWWNNLIYLSFCYVSNIVVYQSLHNLQTLVNTFCLHSIMGKCQGLETRPAGDAVVIIHICAISVKTHKYVNNTEF